MKILAIGASNSANSINRALATYAASLVADAEVEVLDINDYEMPIFSPEREDMLGHPAEAMAFFDKIGSADALVISYAEHNGTYSAAWKNLFDWTSRIDGKVFQGKPAVYLSTSPGGRGGASVMKQALESAERFNAKVVASLSVPKFGENFDRNSGRLNNAELDEQLREAMRSLATLEEAVEA